ncbi:hypothetical protein BGW38_008650 [Lunasporangiospora selenospora]|uniref:Uncharacterized protein n=1 Tax=Lunasporangiospora selenospora TaxID=979761 RepID=A0A9P6FYD1_9FUNG|nr:hypothetical protein BGW38_008650 [Lunasporangiospora selenospora]
MTAAAPPSAADYSNSNSASTSAMSTIETSSVTIAVLCIAFLIGIVYFSKVVISRRRDRRLSKNSDIEGPPTYFSHLQDLQVHVDPNRPRVFTNCGGRLVPVQSPTPAVIRGETFYIATPRTHSRSGSTVSIRTGDSFAAPPRNTTTQGTTTLAMSGISNATPIIPSNLSVSTTSMSSEAQPPAYEDLSPRLDNAGALVFASAPAPAASL